MTVRILTGDVRAMLATLPSDSVQCVVTSPPYWGLRDYGVPGQLGLEPTPDEHVATMVDVFRAVKRVLRDDGVCWVNYGDSYATSVNGRSAADTKAAGNDDRTFRDKPFGTVGGVNKPKDLCMVPFRFAEAMKADGWWLRSILPWVKRNGMPESVSDRPATSIEYVFLFSKSQRYFYDADAVMRTCSENTHARVSQDVAAQVGSARANGGRKTNGNMKAVVRGRDTYGRHTLGDELPESERRSESPKYDPDTNGNDRRLSGANSASTLRQDRQAVLRSPKIVEPGTGIKNNQSFVDATCLPVYQRNFRNSDLFFDSLDGPLGLITAADGTPLALDVPPQPYREAHFATFPPKLIEPLIRAGTKAGDTVLDPFGGSGTTGLVADRLGRSAILIELNPEYAALARRRIAGDSPLFTEVA